MSKYAKGRYAVAECQRSGQKMLYRDLVEDGHIKGLLVHPDWWEPEHPQETPVSATDPVVLKHPAPEISIPSGYGDAENLDGGTAPTEPTGDATGTLATAMSANDTLAVVDSALTYKIGDWLFIELNAGGVYFVSRVASQSDTPAFTVPFTTPFAGAADSGNNFHIEAG